MYKQATRSISWSPDTTGADTQGQIHRDSDMHDELQPKRDPEATTVYQIRVMGHLGPEWTDWFEGLDMTLEERGETLLTGPVVDQAALYSLLKRVRDLGIPLVSVNRVEPGPADTLGGSK